MSDAPPESPREANTRERMQKIARLIHEELPAGWGFAVFAFPLEDESGRLDCVHNANQKDLLRVIKAWVAMKERDLAKHV